MKRTFIIAVLVVTAASIALGQKQSARRDQRRSVEQVIRQLDHERIQAQKGHVTRADSRTLRRREHFQSVPYVTTTAVRV